MGAAAEATADVVETVVEEFEDAAAVVVNNPVVLAAVAVAGTTAGAVGGYFLAKRMLETKFEQRLDEEIDKTRAFYHAQQVKQEKSPVELAAARQLPVELGYSVEAPVQSESDLMLQTASMEASGRLETIEGRTVTDAVEEAAEEIVETVKEEVHSIFEREIPEWDQERENHIRNRSTGPYIISKQEYMENDPEFEQVSLTYFEGDDTLADDRDMPITEYDDLIGEDTLSRFGYGSQDRNVVYARNSVREMDFEIVRSEGDYASTVAGFLAHSGDTRMRRRRGFDE